MDIQGYAHIKNQTTTGISAIPMSEFEGKTVMVLEFSRHDGGALVVNNKATGIAMFDATDIIRSFKCGQLGEVVIPPNLDEMEKIMYFGRAMSRNGGYNHIVRSMVIAASLAKGEFTDNFLWQKQPTHE